MDSPTSRSRYTPQNSKKRVSVAGGSSSVCKEVDVLEISPPATGRSSQPKSSKQKGVIFHEIIDVDMEEECDDASLTDCKIDKSGKGKKVLSSSSVGVNSLTNEKSGNNLLTSTNGSAGSSISINNDEFSSDLYYGEDDWIESYYDDIAFDDLQTLESHFDHMDIPPGVEASFPWLPSSPKNDTKLSTASSSLQSDGINMLPGSNSSLQHTLYPMPGMQMGDKDMEGEKRSSTSHSNNNLISLPSVGSLTHKIQKESLLSCGKSIKKPRSHPKYPSPQNQFPSGQTYPSKYVPLNPLGVGHTMPVWKELPANMWSSSGYMNQSAYSSWDQTLAKNVDNPASIRTSLPAKVGRIDMDEVLQKYDNFNKFETVEDYSDHHYSKSGSAGQPPKNWAKRIQEEWKILESDLPDTIFVRVYESRMDLLRAVIIGAEGTPYHDGLFFFDVFFPSAYPKVPPHVYYHSGGLRINPNLYNSGKVCLSLLNTWSGTGKEKWIPGVSTVLQVLVSIQGLILNAKPYFNEPGHERTSGTAEGERKCLEYNEKTFLHSLRTMVYSMRRPPKHFEDFVYGHFCKLAHDILVSCKAYLGGAQVGCLVRGGVQDVDEGDKSCSQQFKNNLGAFITTLVNTFIEVGAKNCEEFLSLANKGDGPPTPLAHNLFN